MRRETRKICRASRRLTAPPTPPISPGFQPVLHMTPANSHKPLEGIRVFDASQGVAGPHASMLLALHGADVIKVEPLEGDWCRVLGRSKAGQSIEFKNVNRGKRSIALDLKSEAGQEIARRLASECDIFIESFRPGVIKKLGLDFESIKALRPNVIYSSVSGFGQTGPYTLRPSVDGLIQAFTGLMHMNKSPDGTPQRIGMIAVDVLTGLYVYQAISAALIRQIRFDEGAYLDMNMMQATAAFQGAKIMGHSITGGKPEPLYIPSGMFNTSVGLMVVSGMRAAHFTAIATVAGLPELATDPRWPTQDDRIPHAKEIHGALANAFATNTTAYWIKKLHEADVLAQGVNTYSEWLDDAHVKAVNACEWVDGGSFGQIPVVKVPGVLPNGDQPAQTPPPALGQHSAAVMRELGFDEDWIAQRLAAGEVIAG